MVRNDVRVLGCPALREVGVISRRELAGDIKTEQPDCGQRDVMADVLENLNTGWGVVKSIFHLLGFLVPVGSES
ncbi:hypothetical protein EDD31_1843 [Bogoriella caseilytica]|uniref:Uncharacterized protein n=1 Tax=Bogoriella caseilytica TaxID=56055 RepID=A0A3N2BDZ0_9MICO|nr:hypothetical protein EDD31_1843 [Bogoriella caseilytica]